MVYDATTVMTDFVWPKAPESVIIPVSQVIPADSISILDKPVTPVLDVTQFSAAHIPIVVSTITQQVNDFIELANLKLKELSGKVSTIRLNQEGIISGYVQFSLAFSYMQDVTIHQCRQEILKGGWKDASIVISSFQDPLYLYSVILSLP
jgi:hypothetical protein